MGFQEDEPVRSAFQRILLEQTAGITEELRAGNDNPQKTIYEVRKRCKRVRLCRAPPALARENHDHIENSACRKMAHRLSRAP